MKWIRCYDYLPTTLDNIYECSEIKLLYFKHSRKYTTGFWWPIEMTWCDGESMGPYHVQPTHWMDLPKNPEQDPTSWFVENEFSPLDEELKFVWKESYLEVCLGYFKDDDKWYDGDFNCELPSHCTPTHWALLPEAP